MTIDLSKLITAEDKFISAKDAKRAQINAATLAAIDAGFEHQGHVYDSDARSQTNIIGCANAVAAGVPLPADFTWRTKSNENVPIDGPGVIALGAGLLQHVNAQYAISWTLKAEIEAAATPKDLDAIRWPEPAA
ncbi:DUF4376 domain-containing protein [Pusillimonas sp. SM2304]|uniref:DUF4376 domain-containing protein n=1 Tax=Pusillimonas sp. SM2304 TaxID=3073241 RepID=UPI0028749DAF|nr:DUF4376 domain-containing protein [Pusillimonas sp. SM2304]MDS1142383.1 DUF4376 domain-containing protein [Pusillimonas sp. SM2304]